MYQKLISLQKLEVKNVTKLKNSFISIACVDESTVSFFACPGK